MKTKDSPFGKISYVLAWINWLLAAFLCLSFVLVSVLTFLKIDASLSTKIQATLILFGATIFPAVFFFLNGLVLKAKNQKHIDKMEDF